MNFIPSWEKLVDVWMAILEEALLDLQATAGGADKNESSLNDELYLCLLDANARRASAGETYSFVAPIADARNAPLPHFAGDARLKRPDLAYQLHDTSGSSSYSVPTLAIECKRLSSKTGTDWAEEYVVNGVNRFVSVGHMYGYGVEQGVMVGYLQTRIAAQVEAEVNSYLLTASLPILNASSRGTSHAAVYDHSLQRPFPPTPYLVTHYWITV